jgi:hypothetical protein
MPLSAGGDITVHDGTMPGYKETTIYRFDRQPMDCAANDSDCAMRADIKVNDKISLPPTPVTTRK